MAEREGERERQYNILFLLACVDTPSWKNNRFGNNWADCDVYARNYCRNGVLNWGGEGIKMGGKVNNYPEHNCCACGKGT